MICAFYVVALMGVAAVLMSVFAGDSASMRDYVALVLGMLALARVEELRGGGR